MAEHLRTELVQDALTVALVAREPGPSMTHYSDRGCQYARAAFREKLALLGIELSMSRRVLPPPFGSDRARAGASGRLP